MENKEPPITPDEIVNKSKQWTLEGDCTLLRWMEQISKNLEERATKTTSDLNELSTKLERTSIALSNATNSLAALQYTQFVENRVHDDDETLANVEEVPNPSSDVVDKSATDSSMYSFLKKNLEMMNSCHEAYSFSYDDSDEDEPATNVVYRSKNPYESRPLPHIYGTNLWKEKWHIGLCDSDTDFSGDENSEQFSESSSETDNSYESTAQTMSEWDSTAWGLNANPGMEQKQFRLPSNDGESYSQSSVSTPTEKRRDRLPIAQPVQEQRYYQHIPRKQDNLFDDIFDDPVHSTPQNTAAAPPPSVPVQQEKIYHESLIPDEPPPDEPVTESEPNKRSGAKKTLNLFDDDEFSSFMNQIVETAKNVKSAPPPAEHVREPPKKVVPNLFEDHDDLFGAEAEPQERQKVAQRKVEEEKFVPSSPPKAAARTKIRNLFEDDDDDDDDFEKMFAAKQSVADPFLKKTTNLFENDSDDAAGIVAAPVKKLPIKEPPVKEAAVRQVPLMKKGLFDDEEDDLFQIDKPTPTKKAPERNNLFNNDGMSTEATAVDTPKEPSENGAGKAPDASKAKPDFSDLFQDEPPDDIFPSKPSTGKPKVADIFADDFADDFEEFLPKSSKKLTADVEKPVLAPKVDFSDLFQDEPPEDAILPSPVAKAPKMAELFADDFADEPEEPKPRSVPEESKPRSAPEEPKPRSSLEEPKPRPVPEEPKPRSYLEDFPPNPTPRANEKPPSSAKSDKEQVSSSAPKLDKEQVSSSEGPVEQPEEEEKLFVDEQGISESLPTEDQENPPEDDLTPSNSVITQEEQSTSSKDFPKPPPAVPSFSSLFPDEPPSDDEAPPPEPPATDKDVAAFSSINLFADVPPDDDFQVAPPTETKRIHSIFYDDFNETIEATREMRAPSNYIFNDEPPPDDDVQAADDKPQPKLADEKKDKVKVSKLKKFDLQINVGALLPTAKMPSFKKPEAVPQRVDSPPTTTFVTPSKVQSKEVRPDRDLPENILPNLNKNRVKLGVKRRPSTRRGRQESYRKSLIEEVEATTTSDQESDAQSAEPELQKTVVTTTRQLDLQEEAFSSRSFLSKIPPFVREEERHRETSTRATSLFEDFGDFGGGKLTQPEDSSDSLFHDNEAVINPFGTPKTTPTIRPHPSVEVTPTLSNKTASLFKDSDDPPPDEDFPPTKPPAKVVQSSKVPSLFEDSDDGSDDLFKEPKSMKKPTQQKPPESKPKKEPAPKPVKPSSSLFSSDEEGESDDIFGKSKLKVAPKKTESTKTKHSSSLFADLSDDDEDDDLFGTSKKKPSSVDKSKAKPSTPQATKAPAPPQQQATTASYNPLADLLND